MPESICSRATLWRRKTSPVTTNKWKCRVCGFSAATMHGLSWHVHQHGLNSKTYYEKYTNNPCAICGEKIPFRSSTGLTLRRLTCSSRCFGRSVRGKGHSQYKGGSITTCGYKSVSINEFPIEHHHLLRPMVTAKNGRIPEHRATMAISIERTLRSNETVHHRNGVRLDNRPENLELWVGRHGRGTRLSDLKCPHCGKAYA